MRVTLPQWSSSSHKPYDRNNDYIAVSLKGRRKAAGPFMMLLLMVLTSAGK
jgi:hypothetical protein